LYPGLYRDLVNFLHAGSAEKFSGKGCRENFDQSPVERLAQFNQGPGGCLENFRQDPAELFHAGSAENCSDIGYQENFMRYPVDPLTTSMQSHGIARKILFRAGQIQFLLEFPG